LSSYIGKTIRVFQQQKTKQESTSVLFITKRRKNIGCVAENQIQRKRNKNDSLNITSADILKQA
jgi:hypothetical protein